jgi:hypothetical protein
MYLGELHDCSIYMNLLDIKGRKVQIGSTIQFVSLYPPEITSTKTGRHAKILGWSSRGKIKLCFCDNLENVFTVNPERISDCAVLIEPD